MATTIEDVLARMRAIQASLEPRDGVGRFNRAYLHTTEAVRDHVVAGFFHDAGFVESLDVIFAARYFAAVDAAAAGQKVDPAWRPLFASRHDARVQPIQFVVAGMNTHINHDLPIAVVDTCRARSTHPRADHIPSDYRKVNEVLEKVEAEIRRSLLDELERELDEQIEPLIHLVSSWSTTQAREAAWIRAQVLWLLQDDPWLYEQSIGTTARTVGMTSRHLLTPLIGVGTARARTAM
jgi:hypothetical protein